MLSLVSECQLATSEDKEIVSQLEIRESVKYLINQQAEDGSFEDLNPVIHREMQVKKLFAFPFLIIFVFHFIT